MKLKKIPDLEGLYASSDGKIFREVPQTLAHGYPTITFNKKKYGVRGLVCKAFDLPQS